MKVSGAIAAAMAAGLDRLDAQLLLLHTLGRAQGDRAWLLAHDTDELPKALQVRHAQLCERRATGEPLAYIVGHKEFFGLDLLVDKRVLVPRPDTETLVEWAIELLSADGSPKVIDLGCGSGAIALAIKHARPMAHVHASDASEDALAVASVNAARLSLDVQFLQRSWLEGIDGSYDLIVSNPPYIAAQDLHLAALAHEPLAALAAGPDGLDDLRAIISQAAAHLRPGGWLLLEHGWDQATAVRELLTAAGFQEACSRRDLAGIERCSGAKWLELG